MMISSAAVNPSTPLSTISSIGVNNTEVNTATVQSGPYTRAQFQNTIEGSRSVKNSKEIEQLLRDYPAALELYRTGRYKVKVKNEADMERVILVEKRSSKITTSNQTQTNDSQTVLEVSSEQRKHSHKDKSRSRTHSRDNSILKTSANENNPFVQITTSSMRMPSNAHSKVEQYRTLSQDRENSVASQVVNQGGQSKQQQEQQQQQQQQHQRTNRRSNSHDSRSKLSQTKYKGKKHSRDYQNALVPYVPNANPATQMWQQSRAIQPYYSQPILPPPQQQQQPPMSNGYMPAPYAQQQNPFYSYTYYYNQQPYPALTYQKPSTYPTSSSMQSSGTAKNQTQPAPLSNYPSTVSQSQYSSNPAGSLPPTFHTFYPTQQQYTHPQAMYQSQMPYQAPNPWLNTGSRRNSKTRTFSVENSTRAHPPVGFHNKQPTTGPVIEHYHHHHRHHHHHRPQPTQTQDVNQSAFIDTRKSENTVPAQTVPVANTTVTTPEKLTIRQLNQIFMQTDATGRLPYNSVPNILQRFGIALTENDLISAAQSLEYNTVEPLSARRLVHILVKLGKIARSTHQQQRQVASPTLPEDREVNDIMTQRRSAGATSTHIHSSIYPNQWY